MSDFDFVEALPARQASGRELALSAAQLGIWFAQKINPSSPAYNIGEYIEIHGHIEPVLFKKALLKVISESEILRVQFVERDGEPRQIVGDQYGWSLPVIDISAEADPRFSAEAWMKSDLARAIDPTRGPMFGFALFKVSETQSFWYARYHHLVMDAFGMWLVAWRMADVYTQLSTGAAPKSAFGSLATLIEEDLAYRVSEQFGRDRDYWLGQLDSRPELGSIGPRVRPSVGNKSAHRSTAYLQAPAVEHLRSTAQRAGTSLSRLMCAVAAILQHRLTGVNDLIFGLPVAGRADISRRIPGMISNVLPIRLSVRASMTVSEIIDQTIAQIRNGLEHRRYQLVDLRRDVGGIVENKNLFGLSINAMSFNYNFGFAGHRVTAHNLSLGPVEDFSISVYDRADGGSFRIDFDANPTVYSLSDLADRQARFLRLLAAISDLRRTIGSLDILDPSERDTILRVWNDTAQPVAAATLPELFAAQAARTPDAVAVVFEDCTLTYARARRPRQPAGASSARPRRRSRDHGGAVRGALARDGDRAARHPQGRRRLPAARSELPARALGLHAGRRRLPGAGDAIGAARQAARGCDCS